MSARDVREDAFSGTVSAIRRPTSAGVAPSFSAAAETVSPEQTQRFPAVPGERLPSRLVHGREAIRRVMCVLWRERRKPYEHRHRKRVVGGTRSGRAKRAVVGSSCWSGNAVVAHVWRGASHCARRRSRGCRRRRMPIATPGRTFAAPATTCGSAQPRRQSGDPGCRVGSSPPKYLLDITWAFRPDHARDHHGSHHCGMGGSERRKPLLVCSC
jgi:hypothetical protein